MSAILFEQCQDRRVQGLAYAVKARDNGLLRKPERPRQIRNAPAFRVLFPDQRECVARQTAQAPPQGPHLQVQIHALQFVRRQQVKGRIIQDEPIPLPVLSPTQDLEFRQSLRPRQKRT